MTGNAYLDGLISGACLAVGILYFLVLLPIKSRMEAIQRDLDRWQEERETNACNGSQPAPKPRRRTMWD